MPNVTPLSAFTVESAVSVIVGNCFAVRGLSPFVVLDEVSVPPARVRLNVVSLFPFTSKTAPVPMTNVASALS